MVSAGFSRPHSESAEHGALGLSMGWEIWEGMDAWRGNFFRLRERVKAYEWVCG